VRPVSLTHMGEGGRHGERGGMVEMPVARVYIHRQMKNGA
jgi:hypothetical protein